MTDLAKYADMKICVAVSGGRDSMALLHYIYTHKCEYGITLSALNCDHKIRKEASARDSAFVRQWCKERKIPLTYFEWDFSGNKTEASARQWRRECYFKVLESGVDAVATAHHLNDNAETVLFNLARGSSLSGMTGITDDSRIIHPFIACSRGQIDGYIQENGVCFVEDETNLSDDYTRNKLRHNVLPELERAIPNAAQAIYRFSRLAAEDEQYFSQLIERCNLIKDTPFGKQITFCEPVVFKRAAVKVISRHFNRKDYTAEHAERLYNLINCENGKKFEFLGLTALKDGDKVMIFEAEENDRSEIPFEGFNANSFCGQPFEIVKEVSRNPEQTKILKFDMDCIPKTAVIRFMKDGDKFTKFGGGCKSLGDWFTDKKIPLPIRKKIPLIADGNEVLAVGGMEISDKIKITQNTKKIFYLVCADYSGLSR